MNENTNRKLEVVFKIISYIGAGVVFFVSVFQFQEQGKRDRQLEISKTFWVSQNQLYIDICNNAGSLAATVSDSKQFEAEKTKFLSQYYGQIALVSDTAVEKCLVEIRDYLFDVNLNDPNNQMPFKNKIFELSKVCKRSSEIFKNEFKQ